MTKIACKTFKCQICQEPLHLRSLFPATLVRSSISDFILSKEPHWDSTSGYICNNDLNKYRALYIKQQLETDQGELTALDKIVLKSLHEHENVTKDINVQFEGEKTFGERLSDRVAAFGGSWAFIIFFGTLMLIWLSWNTMLVKSVAFDPYPYILLNLVLSCLAALQAPVIMMSQNRQEAKDRLRSEHDYVINLKAELEIRHLTAKVDQLISHQWQRLIEIQQIQTEIMNEISDKMT